MLLFNLILLQALRLTPDSTISCNMSDLGRGVARKRSHLTRCLHLGSLSAADVKTGPSTR